MNINRKYFHKVTYALAIMLLGVCLNNAKASSHREAPLIAADPLADNTDLYAFKSPDDSNSITIIANYIPFQLPHGGPNYYHFGENIRYEIHVDNNMNTAGDDIIYRFTFKNTNEDPTTFFNIRLGKENIKTTYTLERSTNGGTSFSTIITNGVVPAYNVGPRSIEGAAGLATKYDSLYKNGIMTSTTGEKVFCGPVDDPFFVDLGGIFDLGDAPRQSGKPVDGVARFNVHTIAIQVPVSTLQKDGKNVSQRANILDGDYVIGVWASASRQMTRTLTDTSRNSNGNWVQVSRLGMPLTNEAINPVGEKDYWNTVNPYTGDTAFYKYFYNPELALYMDNSLFGGAVPALSKLRIQRNSLGAFDFGNGNDGLYSLKGSNAVAGTALDDAVFGKLLLPGPGKPRSVDLLPIFNTGVPNLRPYQLATGKNGDPLAAGKPFINNFLPNGGDMLRLNMAVPATPRGSANFSSEGIIAAAALGLTDPTYASSASLQFIPNMDGFPNGRRLEDDVTRIELQAVSGIALAAIGLWYDDYTGGSPVTQQLQNVLTYTTGVEKNDTTFRSTFPYMQLPWSGTSKASGPEVNYTQPAVKAPTEFRCDAGAITTVAGQTSVIRCATGAADYLKFKNTSETSADYIYVITNTATGNIVGTNIKAGDSLDLRILGSGTFEIYGVSYTKTLNASAGMPVTGITSTGCFDITTSKVTVTRDSVKAGDIMTSNNMASDTLCTSASRQSITFTKTGNSSVAAFAYVLTDNNGVIRRKQSNGAINFTGLAEGTYKVYGISSLGTLTADSGKNISTATATGCVNVSTKFATVVISSANAGKVMTMTGASSDTACTNEATAYVSFDNDATMSMGAHYRYVLTDDNGDIIAVTAMDSFDFKSLGNVVSRVYGVSYVGTLTANTGANISAVSSTECSSVSSTYITVMGMDCTSSIGENLLDPRLISLFPNPADNKLNIRSDVKFTRLEVVNSLGQVVIENRNFRSNSFSIEVGQLNSGLYFLRMYNKDGVVIKSFNRQ